MLKNEIKINTNNAVKNENIELEDSSTSFEKSSSSLFENNEDDGVIIPYQDREDIMQEYLKCILYSIKTFILHMWRKKLPKDEIPSKPRPPDHRPVTEKIWFLPNGENIFMKIHKSAETLKDITNSSGYLLYIVNENLDRLFVCPRRWDRFYINRYSWKIRVGTTIASYVVKKKTGIIVDTSVVDIRFPRGQELGRQFDNVTDIITVPLMDFKGSCLGALELYRENEVPYEEEHLKLMTYFLNWVGEAMIQNKEEIIYEIMLETYQHLLNCLTESLDLEKEPTSGELPNKFYHEVMHLVSSLTDAERVGIFVNKNEETMKATYTWHSKEDSKKYERFLLKKEKILANLTLNSGWMINMENVFTDTRFDRIAIETGYIIRSVLQTPFIKQKKGIGVLQQINKLSGVNEFFAIDEIISGACSEFCAIWFYYAKLWDRVVKKMNTSLLLKDLIYHQITQESIDEETFDDVTEVPEYLTNFSFFSLGKHRYNLPKAVYTMFKVMCDFKLTDYKVLYNFIYMVKRCYRQTNFFNFDMFGSCTQTVFIILSTYPELFNNNEKISLMIAMLCVCIDRQYSKMTACTVKNNPILEIYDEKPVEKHAIAFVNFLLKESGLLNNLHPEDQEYIRKMIEENMLYSNYSDFMENYLNKISEVMAKRQFNLKKAEHRKFLRVLLMVTGKLGMFSHQPSSFGVALHLFENEFLTVDTSNSETQSCELEQQKKLLTGEIHKILAQLFELIIIPAFEKLSILLPLTEPLYRQAICNYKRLHEYYISSFLEQKSINLTTSVYSMR